MTLRVVVVLVVKKAQPLLVRRGVSKKDDRVYLRGVRSQVHR